jgi:hypothetical protein
MLLTNVRIENDVPVWRFADHRKALLLNCFLTAITLHYLCHSSVTGLCTLLDKLLKRENLHI